MLQVHHLRYFPGRRIWEYEEEHLELLCQECHSKEHNLEILESNVVIRDSKEAEREERERHEHYLRNDPKGNYRHIHGNRYRDKG